jgi:class 3 adenylate cyclase/tetratricopeptide (TPR) repeat protein
VDCTRCGKTNRDDRRFCIDCGSPLLGRCPGCGDELDPGARFCGACGLDLHATTVASDAARETRKVVTIVFADLVGSTTLHERLDAESVRRLMQRYYDALQSVVDAHDGTVVKLMGDGVMVAFGVPHVGEDDALRAVRCAMAMQQTLATLDADFGANVGMGLRVAVNSGEVVVRDDDRDVVGDPVNVAARLQQAATVGEVVIGEPTRRLVGSLVTLEPLGDLALKGRAEAVPAYRVVSMERPPTARSTSFVGREGELGRLLAHYRAAVDTRRAELAVVLGSPGLGKSRLLAETAARIADDACVVAVTCSPGSATFAPLGEGLRVLAGVDDQASPEVVRAAIDTLIVVDAPDRVRVIDGITALLAGAAPPPEETFHVVRRLVGLVGLARPVVLVFDDVHWAQPLLFDLIEHLVEWTRDVALLVLVAGRPELRDLRSSLAMPGRLLRELIVLEGLDASAAARLAADVVGAEELPAVVAGPVLTASDGNPLFLGELVRMLLDDGTLRRDGDRWTATVDLAKVELPPTIHALLASRIERLESDERTVLERAAVVGQQFSRTALAELLPAEVRAGLDTRLEALRRAELIDPDAGWFLGEPMLRFHHVLIREAAYQRVLKETRAELHVRFADWVAGQVADVAEYDELLGLHLEAARDCRSDLGASDADIRVLGDRAAAHLAAAGRRALARDDVAVAVSMLGRAVRCHGVDDEARADLALDWCEALLSSGAVDEGPAAIAELARWANASPRLSAWLTCFRGQLAVLTDPVALRDTVAAVADAAAQLAAAGDDAGEAKAYSVQAQALAGLGEIGACETALDRALVAARGVRDWRRANAVLAGAPTAQLWGPSPLTRASGRCLDVVRVLRITSGSAAVEAVALRAQAVLETLRGRASASRRMLASSRATVEELGLTQRVLEADLYAGIVELYDGDPVAAEPHLRAAYEGLRDRGLADAGLAAALFGRAVLEQGRIDEAEMFSHESEALAGQGFKAAIAWRSLRAESLAVRGEHEPALELATEAVTLAASTDLLLDHADARLAMASVLRAAGRYDEADAEIARAIELWQTKGATALIDRAPAKRSVDALHTGSVQSGSQSPHRRMRENAATRAQRETDAAFVARDLATLERLAPSDAVWVSHPTGREYDKPAALAFLRSMFDAGDSHMSHEPLATLGDRLALFRTEWTIAAMAEHHLSDWGMSSSRGYMVSEVDADGRSQRYEQFGDQLGDAIARLYELYSEQLTPGDSQTRVTAISSDLRRGNDVDSWLATLGPDVEQVDRRRLGTGRFHGRDVQERGMRLFAELATSITFTVNDVLALDPTTRLLQTSMKGIDQASGGSFDSTFLLLTQHGPDGLIARIEMFDVDDIEAALTRFDKLANPAATASRWAVETTATRVQDQIYRADQERDWDAMRRLYSPGLVWHDGRRGVHLDGDIETIIASAQIAFEQLDAIVVRSPVATRGERHALEHTRFTFTDDLGGVSTAEVLSLLEADGSERAVRYEVFDGDDLDTALQELDVWYLEREPRARTWLALAAALNDRDWATIIELVASDAAIDDHRPVSLISVQGRDEMLASWQRLCAVTPDVRLSTVHVEVRGPGALIVHRWDASRDGAEFEADRIVVETLDEDDRVTRLEIYDQEDLDAARARLAELDAATSRSTIGFANAASRACDGLWSASRVVDRRRERRVDVDQMGGSRELLATRDDNLALCRRGAQLELCEVDDGGRIVTLTVFDGADIDAAYDELDKAAGMADDPLSVALSSQDWGRLRTLTAPDVVMEDHRSVGLFTVQGRDELLAIWRGVFDAIPDARVRADHVRTRENASLVVARWIGTRDGVEFNAPRAAVYVSDADGLVCRIDTYDLDQLDEARSRFEELTIAAPAIVPPNAAARLWRECVAAQVNRDWDRARGYCSANFRYVDHTRLAHLESDLDGFIDMMRHVATDPNFTGTFRCIATFGERILVAHARADGGRAGGGWDWEQLTVAEMDADGLISAATFFEVSDRRAAFADARARFLAGEGAATRHVHETIALIEDRFRARDWAAMQALQHPNFFAIRDHRRLRITPAEQTADEQSASLLAFVELAPDIDVEPLRIVAWNEHGALMLYRTGGSTRDGSEFENLLLELMVIDPATNRVLASEMYDIDDVDAAVARFEELTTEQPEIIPASMAANAHDEQLAALQNRDWDRARALCAPDFRYVDHTRAAHVDGDIEMFIDTVRYVATDPNYTVASQRIATFGERVLVRHSIARGGSTAGGWDWENLGITEVDAEGLILAFVNFEISDRHAAFAEARARFVAGEGAATRGVHDTIAAFEELFRTRDWAALQALVHPDFSARDHRGLRIMPAEQTGAEWVTAQIGFAQLAPDVDAEPMRIIAWHDRGAVMLYQVSGTTSDGIEFENILLNLIIVDPSTREMLASELYDVGDLDAAVSRLHDFGGKPAPPVPPNAASRAGRHLEELIDTRNWDGLRALYARDFVFDDRTRRAQVTIDLDTYLDTYLDMVRQEAEQPSVSDTTYIATFGDRIAVAHSHWSGEWSTGAWEFENLAVQQVNTDGLMTAIAMFEVDDRQAALADARARFVADEGAPTRRVHDVVDAMGAALVARDWPGYRAQLHDEFRMRDHRRPAILSEQGPDEYVASLAALTELAPDARPEMFGLRAWSEHGSVMLLRAEGTADAGGPFENVFALVHAIDPTSGRSVALELFDIDDIDAALARFAELSAPDPLRIAPNAATRTFERYMQSLDHRDWDALASLFDPGYEYSDRRTGMHLDGGTEMIIATARFTAENTVFGESTVVAQPTLLAALGDHVCLLHVVWTTPDDAFNNETLIVSVADTNERATATILFDVDDRAAAETELLERAASELPTGAVAVFRGWNTHDLDALAAAVHDDLVFDDKRRTGVGLIEGSENYLASFAAFVEQSPDFFTAPLKIIAANPRGYLALVHNFGTVDGGAYEQVALRINVFEDGKARRFEQFEPEDLELALARFRELCDEPELDEVL